MKNRRSFERDDVLDPLAARNATVNIPGTVSEASARIDKQRGRYERKRVRSNNRTFLFTWNGPKEFLRQPK